jgi:hypothetical protein
MQHIQALDFFLNCWGQVICSGYSSLSSTLPVKTRDPAATLIGTEEILGNMYREPDAPKLHS